MMLPEHFQDANSLQFSEILQSTNPEWGHQMNQTVSAKPDTIARALRWNQRNLRAVAPPNLQLNVYILLLESFTCLCVYTHICLARLLQGMRGGNVGRFGRGRLEVQRLALEKEKAPTVPPISETLRRRQILSRRGLKVGLFDYFFGRTESFIALPTRNFSVVLAGI